MISDGQANGEIDVEEVTSRLFATRVGSQSCCISIGIGARNDGKDETLLECFGKSGYWRDGMQGVEMADMINFCYYMFDYWLSDDELDDDKERPRDLHIDDFSDLL